jgi:hypothetical protein
MRSGSLFIAAMTVVGLAGKAYAEPILLKCTYSYGVIRDLELEISEDKIISNGRNDAQASNISIGEHYISWDTASIMGDKVIMVIKYKIDRSSGTMTETALFPHDLGHPKISYLPCAKEDTGPKKF